VITGFVPVQMTRFAPVQMTRFAPSQMSRFVPVPMSRFVPVPKQMSLSDLTLEFCNLVLSYNLWYDSTILI
jgi:hypothetical protein